ncbi:ArsA-related P-loop ATPase [Streptomyces sp. ME01-24h]|nr:ArsA-related P-loop ATPase [Streptomyces sp. ME19-03-3]MDX3353472.1 ArsA-related P-loop ATPase [Streptomyces sp. ME01-24h]
MRTLLVTGMGGAGRTTAAAATAVAASTPGRRVLLLSTDRDASLDRVLGPPCAPAADGGARPPGTAAFLPVAPVPSVPGLWAARIDAAAAFRADAQALQQRLGSLLDLLGAAPLDPEELTELPGADAFALLRALRDTADGWDLVVVDLPPVHDALAALALPAQLRRYLTRLIPQERQAARALRPVLAQLAGVPAPGAWAHEAAVRADRELAAAQAVIEDAATTVRLVVTPGTHAADAVRRARTGLALYGHRLEAVVANRLLPDGSPDPWLAELAAHRRKEVRALQAELAGTPTALHELAHLGREPRGAADLERLAARPPAEAPEGPAAPPWTTEDRLAAEGRFLWRLPLPGATRDAVDLVRRGDELVVDAEGYRRILPLPSALRRCTVAGAALRDGALQVRFAPDPGLWPR